MLQQQQTNEKKKTDPNELPRAVVIDLHNYRLQEYLAYWAPHLALRHNRQRLGHMYQLNLFIWRNTQKQASECVPPCEVFGKGPQVKMWPVGKK